MLDKKLNIDRRPVDPHLYHGMAQGEPKRYLWVRAQGHIGMSFDHDYGNTVAPSYKALPSKAIPLIRPLSSKTTPLVRPLPSKATPLIRSLP